MTWLAQRTLGSADAPEVIGSGCLALRYSDLPRPERFDARFN